MLNLTNSRIVIFEIIIIILSIGLLYQLSNNNQKLYQATNQKLKMHEAANELRQSSDYLTHFARTYVVTGDEKFKKQYNDVLAIREGKKEKPLNYSSIYWDLDEKTRQINHKDSEKISLDTIFKSLPYDTKEIEKLELARVNSDDLVKIEVEAFMAMEGKIKNNSGEYISQSKSNQKLAIKLMHSKEYYEAKRKIMQPIDEFILILEKRTTNNILDIQSKSKYLQMVFFVVFFIFIVGNYFIYRFLNHQEKIKLKEKNSLIQKQKELNEQLNEQNIITQNLNRDLEESEYELQTININLTNTIEKELAKNNQIKEKLFKSEKMASMGEMIGNIAHQWRQPLSVISTASTGIIMEKEYGVLDESKLIKTCTAINNNAQYLSKTIDDFKNFIKGDRIKQVFSLESDINSFLNLVEGSIKTHNINIIQDIQKDITIDGYENELTQCLINIFNNAKDALKENINTPNIRYIFITAFKEDDKIVIKLKDNGGGIPETMLRKIFEPYFTTKHKSLGTGLGLHMTYNLIVDGMGGIIEASNAKYQYDGVDYIGAEFTILLPI